MRLFTAEWALGVVTYQIEYVPMLGIFRAGAEWRVPAPPYLTEMTDWQGFRGIDGEAGVKGRLPLDCYLIG